MIYSRRVVYALAILWALALFNYVIYTIPLQNAALSTLMRFYGLTALGLLFAALTPGLIQAYWPTFRFNPFLIYVRRSIGVSTFFFAFLHGVIGFFNNLGGSFQTIFALPPYYQAGLIFSSAAFLILGAMALTSFDKMIALLGGSRWKWLHRLVYIAAIFVLVHAFLLGSHFTNQDAFIPKFIKWFSGIFIILECIATAKRLNQNPKSWTPLAVIVLVMLGAIILYAMVNLGGSGALNIHSEHINKSP